MRANGASNRAILQLFVIEGLVIGALSWVGGLLLSLPISYLTSRQVGMVFTKEPLTYIYELRGPLFWLIIALIVAALASLLPARNVANLSVREMLA